MYTVFRKELKYILPRKTAFQIQQKIAKLMDRDAHGENGTYFIRSQYYDSMDDRDLKDNLDGVYVKRKIRLRIYDLDSSSVKLEYKCKNGMDGAKYSMTISREEALRMQEGDFSFLLEKKDELALRLYLRMTEGTYRPKTIVDYQRLAFCYPAGDVRVTFDTDIRNAIYPYGLFEELGMIPSSDMEQVLMEVKFSGILPQTLQDLLKEADSLITANSKYSRARMSL